MAPVASSSPSDGAEAFPTDGFGEVSEEPVSDEVAAGFQAILDDVADDAGVAATVMTADGTWSGAAGTADGVRGVRIDDQFAIGSITKSVVAAQVMQMVEAGELALDDLAADDLPADLDFDTNQATVRQLLDMHSGIPDYVDALWDSLSTDRQRRWTPADLLELVADTRRPADAAFDYSSTNYVLLGQIIEHIRGRPLAAVLRDGVLRVDGTQRLVYQPAEMPTEPMAMPGGESTAALELGGGYLPSLAGATAAGPAGGIASDSPSLARWWRAFCAGQIVSAAALTEMSTLRDNGPRVRAYGLGLFSPSPGVVGHDGVHVGYVSLAGCLPEVGSVVVVLSNGGAKVDVEAITRRLIAAAGSA